MNVHRVAHNRIMWQPLTINHRWLRLNLTYRLGHDTNLSGAGVIKVYSVKCNFCDCDCVLPFISKAAAYSSALSFRCQLLRMQILLFCKSGASALLIHWPIIHFHPFPIKWFEKIYNQPMRIISKRACIRMICLV